MSACGPFLAPTPRTPPRIVIPSSPDLPSPTQLFGADTELTRSSTRPTRSLADEESSFETASALLRREIATIPQASDAQLPRLALASSATRKRESPPTRDGSNIKEGTYARAIAVRRQEGSIVKGRGAPVADRSFAGCDTKQATGEEEKTTKKGRSRPRETLAQTLIAPGKITKPCAAIDNISVKSKKTKELTKCAKETTDAPLNLVDLDAGRQAPLGIGKALARRLDWTPTKESRERHVILQDVELDSPDRASASSPTEALNGQNLASILGQYNYGLGASAASLPAGGAAQREQTLKRRKIEVSVY